MKLNILIFQALFFAFFLIACNQKKSSKCELLEIKPNSIVFYYPDEQKIDSLIKLNNGESNIEESLSDFSNYISEIIDLYHDSSLTIQISNNRYFSVNDSVIDRNDLNSDFGIIISGNKNNLSIHKGIMTDLDYMQIIEENK
ncbi:hypothetical protein ACUNWD_07710 [Sunxiuqinia sp. A32]|uniref:hypothetical protein n=1 Tax=Sunxiuqinia sp. A32 TaxID=3461496 RepID=UPI0040453FD5